MAGLKRGWNDLEEGTRREMERGGVERERGGVERERETERETERERERGLGSVKAGSCFDRLEAGEAAVEVGSWIASPQKTLSVTLPSLSCFHRNVPYIGSPSSAGSHPPSWSQAPHPR